METAASVSGNVDQRGPLISGWAVDFDKPQEPCALDLFINDIFIQSLTTDHVVPRPDVRAAYPELPADHYGFRIDIRPWLNAFEQTVEIRYQRTGGPVLGGSFPCTMEPDGIELIFGRSGYVFYKGDSNDALMQLSRPCPRPEREVDAACMALAATQAVCRNFNAVYGAIIVPDRAAALPEEVGNSFELSPKRPALRLIERAATRFGLPIEYPLDRILALPPERRAPKYDTHLGSFATYQAFLALAARHFPQRSAAHVNQIAWADGELRGDLAKIGRLDVSETSATPKFEMTPVELFDTLKLFPAGHFTGSTRVHLNEAIEDGVALIFGTSSSIIMLPFFAVGFRLVAHVWNNAVDFDLISALRPTHVFHVMTEKTIEKLTMPIVTTPDRDRIIAAKNAWLRPANSAL